MRRPLVRPALVAFCLAATLTACGTPHHASVTAAAAPGATQDSSLLTPYGEPLPSSGGTGTAGSADSLAAAGAAAPRPAGDEAFTTTATTGGLASGGGTPDGTGGAPPALSQAALRAGFVDDNDDFDAYQAYRAAYTGPSRDVTVAGRRIVTVTDPSGMPLLGAAVTIGDVTALSHVDGRTLFTGVAPGDAVSVVYGTAKASGTVGQDVVTTVPVGTARTTKGLTLDLDLVLDTTGSMGDEIDRLNSSLQDVATRLDALPSHPTVRYGLTVYKDHQDAYVFRTHDFTDLATFSKELAATTADGGGDTPEALDEAFHGSVEGPTWGQDTSSVELMLLVSDAPSHLPGDTDTDAGNQTPAQQSSYDTDVLAASRRGIEVVPIAASGTDDTAEYEFRQLAQRTLGTFFFLTYGADGQPGDGTTTHVSGYQTGDLGSLVVDHVSARLAAYDVKAGTKPQAATAAPTSSASPRQ